MPVKKNKCIKDDCKSNNYKYFLLCRKHYVDENRDKIQTNPDGSKEKFCTNCAKFRDADGFIAKDGKPTSRCDMCLATTRRAEAKRGVRDRKEQYKEYEKRPARKAARIKYREDNPEQHAKYYMDCRARKITEDEEAYLKRNRENARKWRAKNPEYMKKQYAKDKLDINRKLYTCKRSAEVKGIEWNLTDKYAKKMFKEKCFYCTEEPTERLTGIDRVNNAKPYEPDNVVPCCKMCNYMKNSLDICTFIQRCTHIATFNKLYVGDLFPQSFTDCKSSSYNNYKKRAEKKEIAFDITEKYFKKLTKKECYICGKKSNRSHKNGVDRIDNNEGYTEENTASCCNCCNVMKREFVLEEFLAKCLCVTENCSDRLDQYEDVEQMGHLVTMDRDKIEVDRKAQLAKRNKQKRNRLMDPKYREKRAAELGGNKRIRNYH